MSDDFDAAVSGALQPSPGQAARVGFATAYGVSPDAYAEALRIQRRTGIPADSVLANPQDAKREAAVGSIDFNALAKSAPATAALLADVERAKVAHDDLQILEGTENALKSWQGPKPGFASVAGGFAEALKFKPLVAGMRLWMNDLMFGSGGDAGDQVRRADLVRKAGQAQAQQDYATPAFESSTASGLYSGGVSLLQNLPGLAASIFTGSPAPGLALAGLNAAAPAYGKYSARGATAGEAKTGALSEGAIEVATEALPMGFLVKNFGRVGAGQFLAGMMGREIPSEIVATVTQNLVDAAIANPDVTMGDYLKAQPDAIYQTVLATLVQGGVMGGASKIAQVASGRAQQAQMAEDQAARIEQFNQFAAASKVLQRDPETFESFVREAAAGGPVQSVFIDAQALLQSGVADQVAAASPAVAAQLETAAATGGTIAIPVEEYAAKIAPTDAAGALLDHLRTDPEGYSRAEAQAYLQDQDAELQAEVERVLADREAADTFKAQADVVKAKMLDQLNAAGRFTGHVNEAYASMVGNSYAVWAAKMGATPEEMYQRYPLTVTAQGIGGEQLDQAGARRTERIVDLDGNGWRVQYFNDKNGTYVESQRYPTGKILWRAGEVIDGMEWWLSSHEFESKEKAQASIRGLRISNSLKAKNAQKYGDIPNTWRGEEKKIGKAIIDAGFSVDRFSSSTQSTSKYIYLQNGLKVRLSDHALPSSYDSPDIDFRYGGDVQSLVYEIRKASSDAYRQGPRGAFSPATWNISLLKGADLSTFLHETGHAFLEIQLDMAGRLSGIEDLTDGEREIAADAQALMRWFGLRDLAEWQGLDFEERRGYHEQFARGFESYLFEGRAPSIEMQGLFQRFRAWLMHVYRDIKALNVELSDEVRGVMDRMIATNEQIQLAEQGRSMLPLFRTADQAGMTPEEFAAYQALGIQATADAIEDLQARGLRDLQWIRGARSREMGRLQKEADTKRAQVRMDVRREVMSQPVYQAWQFLTGKISEADKLAPPERVKSDPDIVDPGIDSLFEAVAKLGGINRESAAGLWGLKPEDKPQSGLFGKPVLRAEGKGLTVDQMAEKLAELGYLEHDENGNTALRDFEEAFHSELGGSPVYSSQADYDALRANAVRPGDQIIAGNLGAGRLDAAALGDIGAPAEAVAAVKTRRMTAAAGLHPDIVADLFGFSSGDELVRTLADATPPKEEIDALTDQRMLERFGELATPEAIQRAADVAIHNAARGRMLATEANALAKATGQRRVLNDAARQFAAVMIARLKVRDIRPGQYASAEARASRAAQKASHSGDLATAAAETRNALVNHHATRAAYDAQEEVRATLRRFAEFANRPDKRLGKTYDLDIANAARAILGEYGIAERRAKKAGEYLKAVESYDSELYGVLKASLDAAEAHAKPVQEMTVEEVRGLRDEIDAMIHLARRSRQMEIDGDLIDRQEVEDELYARLEEVGIPDTIPGEGQAVTPADDRRAKLRTFIASARRVESWAGSMDGGDGVGPFRRYVFSRIKDAADAYRADKAVYLRRFRGLLDGIAPTLKPQLIAAPELGYTFGKDSGGSAMNEILHALLHTGNGSNKRKLLLGRKWAQERQDGTLDTSRWEAFVARMVQEGKLTKAHMDFVQGVWDLLDETRAGAQRTHRDVFGRYFDEVTAEPVPTPWGEYRGGYVPAMADARVVQDANLRALAEEDNAAMAYAFPTTPKGFTKARVEYNRPLTLDLRTLAQHLDKVLLFTHMEMPVRDVQRVLSKKVGQALGRVDPQAVPAMLQPWLARAARQQVETPVAGSAGLMRFFTVMRARAGAAAMFANVSNAAQQVTGFALAAVKVRPGLLLSATADYLKAPRGMAGAVAESSPYMASRMDNEVAVMNGEINDILLNPSLLEKGQDWTMRHAYFLQSAVDNVMGPIIWTAAYNQAVEAGETERDAIRLADAAVRETQGSSLPEDISRIESGNAFVRLFTQFAGYFNMQANLLGGEFVKIARDGGLRQNAGRGLFVLGLGFLAPAIVAEAIAQLFRGGPDDADKDGEYLDDWIAALFGWAPLRNATAMVPVVGQGVSALINAANSKPYDDRLATSPAVSMLESAARAPVSAYKALAGEGSVQKAVRDVATLISMTVGLPANLAARPIGYAAGVADGRINPTGPADAARGAITGAASPESRR